uniref:Adhesion G protein-coupled receptor G7 n=1 Tax=Echeneis naucrates TaxID=173247 RepID=A0A665TK68_ECHNA
MTSPPSTTTLPPPTTPLVCHHGGRPDNGVCVCPDKWTGETCSVKNFCSNDTIGNFSFPETLLGQFAYSEQVCEEGTVGAGKPKASTRCSNLSGLVEFDKQLTTGADLETLASSTQILTSRPEDLTPENITTASQIADSLLRVPNVTEVITSHSRRWDSSQSLLQSVQPVGHHVTSVGEVISERLSVNLLLLSTEDISKRQEPSRVSLGFVLYQNNRFFSSRRYRSRHANVRVLSGSIRGQHHSVVPQHVELLFKPELMNGTLLYDFACVFWDYGLDDWNTSGCSKGNTSDGILRCFCNHTTNFAALWSYRKTYEDLQALDWISKIGLSVSVGALIITIFFHLKDYFQKKSSQTNMNSKITLLSIYVSLLAFTITFLFGAENRENNSEVQNATQANIIPDSDVYVKPDHGLCTAVAALLHFFLLATFMWNSLYGTQLVLLIRTMRSSLPPYWTGFSLALGWGAPAVVMAITLGTTYRVDNPLGYRQQQICWLAAMDEEGSFDFGKPMFWAFILPVGLILVYNTVLSELKRCFSVPLFSSNPSSLRRKFLTSFSLAVILGLSWFLGYMVLFSKGTAQLIFSIFFCLSTTTQGLQIFILFTARKASFRSSMSRSVEYVSSVNILLQNTSYNLQKMYTRHSSSEFYRALKDRQSTSQDL